MKLTVLLFGILKIKKYNHWTGNKYYENYKQFIFDYFESIGYDIYFTTNILHDENKKNINLLNIILYKIKLIT